MKSKYNWILSALVFILVFAIPNLSNAQFQFPKYTGYVNDFENIIDNDEELNNKLIQFEKDSTVEIVVVTTDSFQGSTIEDYSNKLFEEWKIGKKDIDNGLLIVVSNKERQSRIEVGYGLEGTLPDALTGRIQDQFMIPSFKEGKYSDGINSGVDTLIGYIKEDPTVISSIKSDSNKNSSLIDVGIYILIIGFYLMAGSKSWWLGGVFGFVIGLYFGITNGIYLLILITTPLGLLFDYILSQTGIGKAIFHGTSLLNGGKSGSSGGISFGGGSSGGGGSSRSW
jgi:uncharacterized protein